VGPRAGDLAGLCGIGEPAKILFEGAWWVWKSWINDFVAQLAVWYILFIERHRYASTLA
jgi:hypothetical protein